MWLNLQMLRKNMRCNIKKAIYIYIHNLNIKITFLKELQCKEFKTIANHCNTRDVAILSILNQLNACSISWNLARDSSGGLLICLVHVIDVSNTPSFSF